MPANPFLASPLAGQPVRGFARPGKWLAPALLAGLFILAVVPPAAADTVCGRVYTLLSGNRFYMSNAGGQAVPVRLAWTYAPDRRKTPRPLPNTSSTSGSTAVTSASTWSAATTGAAWWEW